MGTWARASGLTTALACPPSTVMPKVNRERDSSAFFGTELHAWKAGGEPTERVAAWLARQRTIRVPGDLWPGGRHEVLLWLTTRSCGLADRGVENRDLFPHNWTAGEADWITLEGLIPWVDDLKTGAWEPGTPRPQLLFYALVLSEVTGSDVMVSVTHWPRYPLGEPPRRETRVFTRPELAKFRTHLENRRDLGKSLAPGDYCKFCDARPGCPAWTAGGLLPAPGYA